MALDLQRVGTSMLLFQMLFWVSHLVSSNLLAYKYNNLSPYDRNQWNQFVCSFVKGTVICGLCYPIAFRNAEQFLRADSLDGAINETDMEPPLYLFLGYALSDLVSIMSYFQRGRGDTAMVVHHVATACIWSYLLALDFAYPFACVACLVECTTPLLALRWFMASSRLKSNPLYVFNGISIVCVPACTRYSARDLVQYGCFLECSMQKQALPFSPPISASSYGLFHVSPHPIEV